MRKIKIEIESDRPDQGLLDLSNAIASACASRVPVTVKIGGAKYTMALWNHGVDLDPRSNAVGVTLCGVDLED